MDFGSGTWDGGPIGIPYNIVGSTVPKVSVSFYYPGESDPGPYPIPGSPLIEYGSDHHILIVEQGSCILYELFDASYSGGQWHAGSGAIWNLNSNALRPDTWTSADAAGLPILPGLVRYDEVLSGEINHAIRFTAANTNGYIWPARHLTSNNPSAPQIPPMGARFRLKASYNISGYPAAMQVILQAMKTYGIILADNGSNWYVSGSPDERWNNDMLHLLDNLTGNDFEAVDMSDLMIDSNSAATGITISGNAGAPDAVLSYTDGTPKTATVDGNGNYSFIVPSGWSGSVTPSHMGFPFTPASRSYSNVTVDQTEQNYTTSWVGGVSISSDKKVVAVGRPHIGDEVASYDGFASGSLTSYVPMLFNNAYGSYNSALYVQNVANNQATITIKYYDSDGNLKCTKNDTVDPLSSKGYWVPSETCLPDGWVGGAVVTSTQPIVTVGRPHVGNEVMTYDGFTGGSLVSYIPMLFNNTWGSYNSAFYIQNVHDTYTANVTIKYYDNNGNLKCTKSDTIKPLASKGYWVPSATCDTGSLPDGWVGGVVVTSDQPIVGVGRPHIGTQVTTYNGFTGGTINSYIPMLFNNAWGSYNAAFYLQNTASNDAHVTIKYYSSVGTLNCTQTDTISSLASKGYWVPSATCLPDGWVGGVVVTSDQPIVGVGRPHIGTQVTTYNGFSAGNPNAYLPMLFNNTWGSYNSAFYIQNTEASTATVTLKFYDTTGHLSCTRTDTIAALSTLGFWVPSVTCDP